jgi:hypothetical protein
MSREKLSLSLQGGCRTCIQPILWASRIFLERDPGGCELELLGFIVPMVVRRPRLVKLRKRVLAGGNMPIMILCESRGLQLFWVMRGGIG